MPLINIGICYIYVCLVIAVCIFALLIVESCSDIYMYTVYEFSIFMFNLLSKLRLRRISVFFY